MKRIFVLLKDFSLPLDKSDCFLPVEIKKKISDNINKILLEHTIEFKFISKVSLDNEIKKILNRNYFIITLDGGSYLSNYDISFEMSRTCLSKHDLRNGKVLRMPRDNFPQLMQQCMELRDYYFIHGNNKPIAIFDDGIGTGGSLKRIIGILDDLNMDVNSIYVLLNPTQLTRINYTDIHTIFEYDKEFDWLSERDLLWGITRSGLTYKDNSGVISGIPYTLDSKFIKQKIGNFKDIEIFRKKILDLNICYFTSLEESCNKYIKFSDMSRLTFFLEHYGKDMRVIDYIESINKVNYEFN